MIQHYLKAGYPAIVLLTQEPHRAENVMPCEGWTFLAWDCLRGFRQAGRPQTIDEVRDPVEAVNRLGNMQDTVLLTHNLHLFLDIPEVVQAIQNGITRWKATGSCLVMVSPVIQLRPEVEKLFTVIDLPLPGAADLFHMQSDLAKSVGLEPDLESAKTAQGLTEFEAETAFALSLVRTGRFSGRVIAEAKAQMIRKSGLMEFWEPANISDVGGLENLKAYIRNRAKAFLPGNEHLPKPKGVLLVGIPGTGKSLSCKATASILGWPLIRLDIGGLKNSLIGESERRMRQATQMIDAFGEAIIWLDEVEKMFAGSRSSGETDAGTTAGMFSHFLSWMAEMKSSALVMATANDISKLPPEFVRAGRFDATFFVDLPCRAEREEIINIMNKRYGSQIPLDYIHKLNGFTGAEIEQLSKDSLFDGLDSAMESIVPLSKTMRENINALRDWAKTRARLANTPEEEPTEQRKIRALN
jgi:AAA+ superfamily predicted ATPase